jgi:hypothetical protein
MYLQTNKKKERKKKRKKRNVHGLSWTTVTTETRVGSPFADFDVFMERLLGEIKHVGGKEGLAVLGEVVFVRLRKKRRGSTQSGHEQKLKK